MKNIFVLNPAAGQREGNDSFAKKIINEADKLSVSCEIYVTKGVGDATEFVRKTCEASSDEHLRFYACGGDGTLNEVVNGAIGFENVSVGAVPIGTGNDFIRNFGDKRQFLDIEAQLLGRESKIDSITYTNEYNGIIKKGSLINMLNVGFDANVADLTGTLKKKPFISGSFAYILGVVILLIKKKGADICVETDGKVLKDGKVLLCAVTNGCYCGGGWKGIPRALTNDGLLDISIVKNLKRRQFIKLVPKYQKGTHLETRAGNDAVTYRQTLNAAITANNHPMKLCIDGESMDSDRISLEIRPSSVSFIIPKVTTESLEF